MILIPKLKISFSLGLSIPCPKETNVPRTPRLRRRGAGSQSE